MGISLFKVLSPACLSKYGFLSHTAFTALLIREKALLAESIFSLFPRSSNKKDLLSKVGSRANYY